MYLLQLSCRTKTSCFLNILFAESQKLSLFKNDANLLEFEVVFEKIESQFPFNNMTNFQLTDPTNGVFLASSG